jgi:hypothetical protein
MPLPMAKVVDASEFAGVSIIQNYRFGWDGCHSWDVSPQARENAYFRYRYVHFA